MGFYLKLIKVNEKHWGQDLQCGFGGMLFVWLMFRFLWKPHWSLNKKHFYFFFNSLEENRIVNRQCTGSGWLELISVLVASVVLFLDLWWKQVLIMHCFFTCCWTVWTVSSVSRLFSLCIQSKMVRDRQQAGRKCSQDNWSNRKDSWSKRYSMLYNVMCGSENWQRWEAVFSICCCFVVHMMGFWFRISWLVVKNCSSIIFLFSPTAFLY